MERKLVNFQRTGNFSIGMPVIGDNFFTDTLIIWPKVFGGYEYGVILYDEGYEYLIFVDEYGNSLVPELKDVVEKHRDNVNLLFKKANEWFNLK